jgi:hypothetical protein
MLPSYREEAEDYDDYENDNDNDHVTNYNIPYEENLQVDEMDEDFRIVIKKNQIARLRRERAEAQEQYEATCRDYHRTIFVLTSKLQRQLKRSTDIRRYNMAMSPTASSRLLFPSPTAPSNSAESFVPQQYVQQQARLIQAWHKTAILQHQMDLMQKHSNDAVTTMMIEASKYEQAMKETECELMIRLGDAMNERFELESKYHARCKAQTESIRTLRGRVIPEEIEIMVRKRMDDNGSVDTMDTWYDSGSVLTYSDAAFEVGVSGSYLWPLAIF